MESNRENAILPAEVGQIVYDTSVENSVASTDNRNKIAAVHICKSKHVKRYHGIENKTVQAEEKKNKHRESKYEC